jgi:polar amino acid transport system substrate-binding protein
MKKLSASIFLFICLASNASELELFTETFPPYNFGSQDNIVGINADILSNACSIAELKCTFNLLPWNRAFKIAYTKRNSGVFSTSRTAQREDNFVWVGPLVSGNACFYRLKNRKDIVAINADSLKKYTVGISRGDIYEEVLQNMGFQKGNNILTYSKKHDDTKMFKRGKLDLIIGSSLTLASQLNAAGLKPEDVVPVFELNDDSLVGNYLALNKEISPIIATSLQNTLDLLKQNGQIESIVAKYSGVPVLSGDSLPSHLERCVNGQANY